MSHHAPRSARRGLMAVFADLSVAKKIQLLIAVMVVGIGASLFVSLHSQHKLNEELANVGRQQLPAVRNMTLVDMMHDGIRAVVLRAIVSAEHKDAAAVTESAAELTEFNANVHTYLAAIEALHIRAETRASIAKTKPALEAYVAASESMMGLVVAGKVDEAYAQIDRKSVV